MNTKSWQRLTLSLLGIIIILAIWRWSVAHLYTLPESSISAFAQLTSNSFYTISSIVIFMISGRMLYEWKMNTANINSVSSIAQDIKQDINKNISVKMEKAKNYDDGGQDLDITNLDL